MEGKRVCGCGWECSRGFVACRTLKSFEQWLKRGARGTDYVFPSEMLVMMNVIVDFKNHHRYSDVEFLDTVQTEMSNFLMERVSYDFLRISWTVQKTS